MAQRQLRPSERRAQNLAVALNAVNTGLAILLVGDDKRPLWPAWQRLDADISSSEKLEIANKARGIPTHYGSTRDVLSVKRLFQEFPDALPAACAGLNGLIVIDVDTKEGGPERLAKWMRAAGHVLPEGTPLTTTQSGGQHIVFRDDSGLGNRAGALQELGCDVRGKAGYIVLPGAVRGNGAAYRQQGEVGLLSSFATGSIPHLPEFFRHAIESRSTAPTATAESELAPIIQAIRAAGIDDEPRFCAAELLTDDKGGDRSKWRLALANRLRETHRSATVEDYAALLLANGDLAGSYVANDRPGEGEFNERNIARDWMQAGKLLADRDAKEARSRKASERFGAVIDDPVLNALAELRRSVDAGKDVDGEVVLHALREAGLADTSEIEPPLSALDDPLDDRPAAVIMDAVEVAALKARDRAPKPAADGNVLDVQPAHYVEAKARKALRNAPFGFEDQKESADLIARLSVEPLIDGLLDQGAISILYGASNVGKSFVAAHLAYHVAAGLPWSGRDTARGAVIFFALEGRTAFRRRVVALTRALNAKSEQVPATFATVDTPALDLKSPAGDAARIIATVREVEKRGEPVRLVVVDTLAAATPGMDESGAADMTAFVEELKRIRASCPSAHLMVVHHAGKDLARGARGHSSLRAAVDTELEVTPGCIAVSKQRDHEFGPPVGFRLAPVILGDDERGRPMRTAVVELKAVRRPADGSAFGDVSGEEKPLSEAQHVIVAALQTAQSVAGVAVKASAVIQQARTIAPQLAAISDETLGKTLQRLALDPVGPVEKVSRRYRLRESAA